MKSLPNVAPDLELHFADISHDASHLRSLCGLVEQRHLAQVVCSLGSSLACTIAVWSVLEARMPLGGLALLLLMCLLCLLIHGAVVMLLLA
jgi:hypothetical protein